MMNRSPGRIVNPFYSWMYLVGVQEVQSPRHIQRQPVPQVVPSYAVISRQRMAQVPTCSPQKRTFKRTFISRTAAYEGALLMQDILLSLS